MANVIIKSEERREHEAYVMKSFGVCNEDKEGREHAEVIAAKSREAIEKGKQEGGRKSWSW